MEQQRVEQKLSAPLIIVLIAALSSSGPIATDIFLPAVPSMPASLNTTEPLVNLCITAFFLTQGIGMLIFGPLSDRYGRKRVLAVTLALFLANAILASLATNILVILCARAFQGLGGGGNVALATAMVKDIFVGEKRQKTLVVVQAIAFIAPICAPLLGAAILTFTTWRGTFVAQAIIGLLCVAIAVALKEPLALEDRTTGNPLSSLKGLVKVGKNPTFIKLLLATSPAFIGAMAYVTCASYVYIDIFGLSTLGYSAFFSANAALGIVSTLLIMPLLKRFNLPKLITCILLPLPIFGLMVIFIGQLSPWAFFITMALSGSVGIMLRPLSTNVLLGLQEGDTGSASSLINFAGSLLNCCGSLLISLPWPNYIVGIGCISIIATGLAVPLWFSVRKRVAQSLEQE